jgi:hypothetical protein
MGVISISIEISEEEVIAGIPKFVELSTNVSSNIFYTLDGTEPDYDSNIYIDRLYLPRNKLSVTLKLFATNGSDSSSVISQTWGVSQTDARVPRFATSGTLVNDFQHSYPFGTGEILPQSDYLSSGKAGINVYDNSLSAFSSGFNSDGYPNAFSNEPYNIQNYQIKYTNANAIGEEGPFIGNIPGKITFQYPTKIPQETQQFTKTFDPRAFVIFQDFSKQDPTDPAIINQQSFSLDSDYAKNTSLYKTALEAPPMSGNALRSFRNLNDDTIKYYYFDSWANRWIISTQKFERTGDWDGNMSYTPHSNKPGSQFVYEFIPFSRRVLY